MDSPEIFRVLGRIEAEVKSVATVVSELKNDNGRRLNDHERRLRVVEQFQWKAAGVILTAVLAFEFVLKKVL